MTNKWISVKDKLPPNYEEVIYAVLTDVKRDVLVGHRVNELWYNCYLLYISTPLNHHICKVTHWMAMPDFPDDMEMPVPKITRLPDARHRDDAMMNEVILGDMNSIVDKQDIEDAKKIDEHTMEHLMSDLA